MLVILFYFSTFFRHTIGHIDSQLPIYTGAGHIIRISSKS